MGDQSNLEDEMSRFEREILGAGAAAPTVPVATAGPSLIRPTIGANTFASVQEQLASLRAQVYGGGSRPTAPGTTISAGPPPAPRPAGPMSAPPRPPGFTVNGGPPRPSPMGQPLMRPPVPPGLNRPTGPFLPPQLRARGPDPGGPPRPMPRPLPGMRPPPPGMMPGMHNGMGPPMMGPRGPMNHSMSGAPVQYSAQPRMEAPKVVYTSKPVLNKPTTVKKDTDKAGGASKDSKQDSVAGKKRDAAEAALGSSSDVAQSDTGGAAGGSYDSELQGGAGGSKKDSKRSKGQKEKKRTFIRTAANDVWEDTSLSEWDPNDFRVFCGDLGNEVTDEKLAEAFKSYPSLQKAKVIRDRRTHKTKGYGFISFSDPTDYTRAMREMNGKYVGNRPIKLRKSNWRDRNVEVVKKKDKEKKRLGFR